jgi:hypothetical protein
MTLISTLRERRNWSILQHPIDVQVDVLECLSHLGSPSFGP